MENNNPFGGWGVFPWSKSPEERTHTDHAAHPGTVPGGSPPHMSRSTSLDKRQQVHRLKRTSSRGTGGGTGVLAARRRMSRVDDLAPPVLRSVSAAPAPSSGLRSSTATSGPPPIVRAKSAAATAAGGGHATLADISSGRPLWQEGGGGGEGGRQGLQTRHTSSSLDSEDLPPEVDAGASGRGGTSSIRARWAQARLKGLVIVDHPATTWILIVITMFVIFQEDLKYAAFEPQADVVFEGITLAFLLMFLVEIGISSVVRPGFLLSFYWWLDVVATISLGFELPALRATLLLGATQEYVDLNQEDSYLRSAGAAALVSSKAGRAAKMVRLFRQLQLIRLFREFEQQQQQRRSSMLGLDAAGLPTLDTHAASSAPAQTLGGLVLASGVARPPAVSGCSELTDDSAETQVVVPALEQSQSQGEGSSSLEDRIVRKPSALLQFRTAVAAAGAATRAAAAAALGAAAGTVVAAAATAAAAAAAMAANLAEAEQHVVSRYKWSNSRVGHRLSDLTIKRVIIGVLAMLVVLPALEITSGVYGEAPSLLLAGLSMLHATALTQGHNSTGFQAALSVFQDGAPFLLADRMTGHLLELRVANTTILPGPPTYTTHRYMELEAAEARSWLCPNTSAAAHSLSTTALYGVDGVQLAAEGALFNHLRDATSVAFGAVGSAVIKGGLQLSTDVRQELGCELVASFVLSDVRWQLRAQSVLGICRTLFLVILLALGANFIHKDTRRLVLLPVERMVTRVKDMAEDPLRQGTMPRVSRSMPDPTASADAAWAEATKASAALTAVRAACRMVAGPRTAAHLSSPAPGAESEMGDSVATSALVSRKQSFAGNNLGGSQMSDASGFVTSDVLGVHHRSCPSPGLPGYEAGDSDSSPSRALRSVKSRRGSWAVYGPQGGPNLAAAVPRLQAAAKKPTTKLRKASHAAGSAVMKVLRWAWRRLRAVLSTLGRWLSMSGEEGEDDMSAGQYETRVLERSIHKICSLLAVGFGDAGAQVIAENIKRDGDLNPMLPGKRTVAIFGFCDIRRFTDTTEVLQEEVMEYVNTIAHIVHTAVILHGGAANKNIGDAFLLVWKMPKGLRLRDIAAMSNAGGAGGGRGGRGVKHSVSGREGRTQRRSSGNAQALPHQWPSLLGPMPPTPPHQQQQQQPLPGSANALGSPRGDPAGEPTWGSSSGCGGRPGAGPRGPSNTPLSALGAEAASSGLWSNAGAAGDTGRCSPRHGGSPLPWTFGVTSDPGGLPFGPTSGAGGVIGRLGSSIPGAAADAVANVSLTGGKRGVLNMKSVKHVALNAAVKATIINTIADNALAGFVITQVALKLSTKLAAYSSREDLLQRMPDFAVRMGFGLHVGWAIEGAIGSEYKIDASYLSPNVNLASRLEAATKQFGVDILLSQDFVDCLSPRVRTRVRQVDCVLLKGSQVPMGLYTYDLDMPAALAAAHQLAMAAVLADAEDAVAAAYAAAGWGGPVAEGAASWGFTPAGSFHAGPVAEGRIVPLPDAEHDAGSASSAEDAAGVAGEECGTSGHQQEEQEEAQARRSSGESAIASSSSPVHHMLRKSVAWLDATSGNRLQHPQHPLPSQQQQQQAGLPGSIPAVGSRVSEEGTTAAAAADDGPGGGPGGVADLLQPPHAYEVDTCETLLCFECEDDWTDNPVLVDSWALSSAFRAAWDEALQAYLDGDWSTARRQLEHCLIARTDSCGQPVEDGPSRVLLEVLKQHDYRAPPGWSGCRELTEK